MESLPILLFFLWQLLLNHPWLGFSVPLLILLCVLSEVRRRRKNDQEVMLLLSHLSSRYLLLLKCSDTFYDPFLTSSDQFLAVRRSCSSITQLLSFSGAEPAWRSPGRLSELNLRSLCRFVRLIRLQRVAIMILPAQNFVGCFLLTSEPVPWRTHLSLSSVSPTDSLAGPLLNWDLLLLLIPSSSCSSTPFWPAA